MIQTNKQFVPLEKQQFFIILDAIDRYDTLTTQLNTLYNEAIIQLAYLKIQSESTSISSNGFQPTPALVTLNSDLDLVITNISSNQNQSLSQKSLCSKTLSFFNRVDITSQYHHQQDQIENSLGNILWKMQQVVNSNERKNIGEISSVILDRFNILNKTKNMENISKQFQQFYGKCMEIIKERASINKLLDQIEQSRRQILNKN